MDVSKRQIKGKINIVQEWALRIVYDTALSFEHLLIKNNVSDFMISIEIYKTINNLPGRNLSEY